MKKVTLHIHGPYESKSVSLDDELTIGRTDSAQLVLDDAGLSRVNTTIFRDEDEIFVSDENSLNGTFLNGRKITGPPQELRDGDEIRIGSDTRIRVEVIGAESWKNGEAALSEPGAAGTGADARTSVRADSEDWSSSDPQPFQIPQSSDSQSSRPPMILIAAGLMTFSIIAIGLIAFLIVSNLEEPGGNTNRRPTPQIAKGSAIPVRVIDPLGGEDEEDLDDLIASWETEEEEIKIENIADIKVESADAEIKELNVTAAFLAERKAKAFEPRNGETGIRPGGLNVPRELFGDGVIKQKAKLREMNSGGYKQPLDFAELAEKRMSKALIEMPMAQESYYLDVGGSASDGPFTSFAFPNQVSELAVGNPKYGILSRLASNFAGQTYDLNNPAHRKQMRMRLLRMFNKQAKPILLELAGAYYKKFNRPLRVTSLTRSMDYQILLNSNNPNSFKVRGEGSLPPHTSGCAFDLARKHMTAEEQNFVMQKLAEMEKTNKLDALIEYGANACFHVFIYDDGRPPKM